MYSHGSTIDMFNLIANENEPAVEQDESQAFQFIISLIYSRSGIRLHDGKQHLIRARLAKRMRHHGFTTLSEYCHFLRKSADEDELTQVVDALTTNFTNFLREEDHFKFMVQHALPGLLRNGRKKFRIWSAACSSGEEPYTIGFFLSEHFPQLAGWDWTVLGTDISTRALQKGMQGIYSEDRLTTMPKDWMRKYFQKGQNNWNGHYKVKTQVAERIEFCQINLLDQYSFAEPFEIIFCRNVMIYFDRETQERLVRQLAKFLVPNGYLLIGHAESLTGLKTPFKCLRPSIYQKE